MWSAEKEIVVAANTVLKGTCYIRQSAPDHSIYALGAGRMGTTGLSSVTLSRTSEVKELAEKSRAECGLLGGPHKRRK
jgi:hypothetical protein